MCMDESIKVSTITNDWSQTEKHKLNWKVQGFANSGVLRRANGGIQSWAQALRAHHHTLQSFKNMFLSRYLDQNMLRSNSLCFEKSYTRIQPWYARALGVHWHTLQSFRNTFLSRNLDQSMLKNALFKKKLGKSPQHWGFYPQAPVGFRQLGPLSQTYPSPHPSWFKPLVTPLLLSQSTVFQNWSDWNKEYK